MAAAATQSIHMEPYALWRRRVDAFIQGLEKLSHVFARISSAEREGMKKAAERIQELSDSMLREANPFYRFKMFDGRMEHMEEFNLSWPMRHFYAEISTLTSNGAFADEEREIWGTVMQSVDKINSLIFLEKRYFLDERYRSSSNSLNRTILEYERVNYEREKRAITQRRIELNDFSPNSLQNGNA